MAQKLSIEWFQSAIIRQQIVGFILSGLTLLGITTDLDINQLVGGLMAGAAALISLYTIGTRLFKPAPPITDMAQEKLTTLTAKEQKK